MTTNCELLRDAKAMLFTTLHDNPSLDPEVAQRRSRLEKFQLKENILYFTLGRHPHLFGHESKGMSSPGFFIMEQHYAFDLDQKTISLIHEQCTGIAADVHELVDEDVERTLEIIDMSNFDNCATEEEVRMLVAEEAPGIAATLQDSILLPDPGMLHNESLRQEWDEFCTEFVELWPATYINAVLERWKQRKEDEQEFA